MAKKSKVPVTKTKKESVKEYAQTLTDLKGLIKKAQVKSILAVNREMIKLYWEFGRIITQKQEKSGWGSNTIEKLATDIQNEFPGIQGFSRRNIFRMKAFYQAYEKVPQAVAQIEETPIFNIPWGHNAVLLEKVKNNKERLWYAQQTIENGWSRSILELWIESDLYARQGKAVSNFKKTLPDPQSDMANQSFKDPYIFDFLTLHEKHLEKEVEQGLIDHIQKFLLELGEGFAFVGRQKHFEIGGRDFYIDLLFYHLKLRCFIVVELKTTDFKPEYTGQLNFYLSVVDDLCRDPNDNPTIGLLLCKTKSNLTVEYALQGINRPIGVAEYTTVLVDQLPKDLKGKLPTIEEIEAELEKHEALSKAAKTKKAKSTKK